MIDDKKIETVSHTIDEVLMYMSHTHELDPLLLASLFMARITLMCDETDNGERFRQLCKDVSEKSMKEMMGEHDEEKVD
jgi:hypothetical protein